VAGIKNGSVASGLVPRLDRPSGNITGFVKWEASISDIKGGLGGLKSGAYDPSLP
jgi:hypothetical protein